MSHKFQSRRRRKGGRVRYGKVFNIAKLERLNISTNETLVISVPEIVTDEERDQIRQACMQQKIAHVMVIPVSFHLTAVRVADGGMK